MNRLLLLSGNDLPFVQGSITIHQPRVKEIAYLGQDIFYLGCNLLCFSKENLAEKDKVNLANKTNFDVLMSMVNNTKDRNIRQSVVSLELVLSLIFPEYQLMKMPTMLVLNRKVQNKKEQCLINNQNFEQFKKIIQQMFCLQSFKKDDYDPVNKLAQQIAQKFRQRHKMLNPKKDDGDKSINILSRYISILTLGNHHTIPELMQYTVFQLHDEFRRFQKKYSYDIWLKSKLAGAKDLQDVDNWMNDEQQNVPSLPKSGRIEF